MVSGRSPRLQEVTVSLWPGDGYFFLYVVRQSPMIAQISNPNWNRSLYVTYISLTPFAKSIGDDKRRSSPCKGALNRQTHTAASVALFYHKTPELTR